MFMSILAVFNYFACYRSYLGMCGLEIGGINDELKMCVSFLTLKILLHSDFMCRCGQLVAATHETSVYVPRSFKG